MAIKPGRGERIRTSGLYVPNVALYQAKLHPDEKAALLAPCGMCRQPVKKTCGLREHTILAKPIRNGRLPLRAEQSARRPPVTTLR